MELNTFKTYTSEELSSILTDHSEWADLAWTFGSWLDRIRDRDWEWWSVMYKGEITTIYISIIGEPFSAKALEHLIISAGGRLS